MSTRPERIRTRFRRVTDAAKVGKPPRYQTQVDRDHQQVDETCRALMQLIGTVNRSEASGRLVDELLGELAAEFREPVSLEELDAAVAKKLGGAPALPLPSQQIVNAISAQTASIFEALRAALQEARKTADAARTSYHVDLRQRN